MVLEAGQGEVVQGPGKSHVRKTRVLFLFLFGSPMRVFFLKKSLEQSDLAKVAEVDESIMNLGLEGKEPRKKGEDDKQEDHGFKN